MYLRKQMSANALIKTRHRTHFLFKGVKVTLMAPHGEGSTDQRNHVFFLQ